jgi:hypothetical protein
VRQSREAAVVGPRRGGHRLSTFAVAARSPPSHRSCFASLTAVWGRGVEGLWCGGVGYQAKECHRACPGVGKRRKGLVAMPKVATRVEKGPQGWSRGGRVRRQLKR